jgi:hypothetical protein
MFLSQLVFQTQTDHLTASRLNTDSNSLFSAMNMNYILLAFRIDKVKCYI